MNRYTTLNNATYDIQSLSTSQKRFMGSVLSYYRKKPHWNEFSNFWTREGRKTWKGMDKKEVVSQATFKICQDLESRLGIEQGYVRPSDYRDELLKIIGQFPSRYQFCKKMGIDEAFLSHILNKRKNLSITKLQVMLDKLGYRITFTETEPPAKFDNYKREEVNQSVYSAAR